MLEREREREREREDIYIYCIYTAYLLFTIPIVYDCRKNMLVLNVYGPTDFV